MTITRADALTAEPHAGRWQAPAGRRRRPRRCELGARTGCGCCGRWCCNCFIFVPRHTQHTQHCSPPLLALLLRLTLPTDTRFFALVSPQQTAAIKSEVLPAAAAKAVGPGPSLVGLACSALGGAAGGACRAFAFETASRISGKEHFTSTQLALLTW